MASKEYSCILRTVQTPLFSPSRWEEVGNPLLIRINLTSMPSKMNALLYAIGHYTRANPDLEKNELCVLDDDGDLFATIYATAEDLRRHKAGYLISVSEGTAPKSLEGFSDEQLIAELRRRLTTRTADSEDLPSR